MGRAAVPGSPVTLDQALRYIVITLGAAVTGLLAGWLVVGVGRALYGVHAAVWLALAGWLVTTVYLAFKPVTSDVVGSTLYFAAVLVVLKPVAHYAPVVRAATVATGDRQSELLLEGMGGLLRWGLLAGVVALLFVVVGRRAKARARRVRRRRARLNLQEGEALDGTPSDEN